MRIISSEGIEVIDLINEINKSYHNLKIEVRNLLKYQFISKFDKFNFYKKIIEHMNFI